MQADCIEHYISQGLDFKPVCQVTIDATSTRRGWVYTNIDPDILYNPSGHWVYAITVDNIIVKWGESINPLGIKQARGTQPITGTKSRVGRYRANGTTTKDTDYRIRRTLNAIIKDTNKRVEFWALKCEEHTTTLTINNYTQNLTHSNNKALEKFLLDYYKSHFGHYPRLNKARA